MKYPDATPVDEPVAKPKQSKPKTYPDSVPVDEPVVKKAEGGMTDLAQDKAMIKKAFKQHDAQQHKGKDTTLKLAKGGSASKRADGCCTKGKTKGKFV